MNIKHENESKIYLVSYGFPDTGKLENFQINFSGETYQPRCAIRTPLPGR